MLKRLDRLIGGGSPPRNGWRCRSCCCCSCNGRCATWCAAIRARPTISAQMLFALYVAWRHGRDARRHASRRRRGGPPLFGARTRRTLGRVGGARRLRAVGGVRALAGDGSWCSRSGAARVISRHVQSRLFRHQASRSAVLALLDARPGGGRLFARGSAGPAVMAWSGFVLRCWRRSPASDRDRAAGVDGADRRGAGACIGVVAGAIPASRCSRRCRPGSSTCSRTICSRRCRSTC